VIGSKRLLDAWLAPEDAGTPVACVATSFAFEPDFFEGQCLPRFLGINGVRGETPGLEYVLEEEERLAEVPVSVLVDRTQNPENRNLRWDLLPVGLRIGGLVHAKITLLAWERYVRVMISSANLTRAGFRSQIEACVALDAFTGSELPEGLFLDSLSAIERIASLRPSEVADLGPVSRLTRSLEQVRRLVAGFELPEEAKATAPRIELVTGGPGRPVLQQLQGRCRHGVPRWADVLSPYFDAVADRPSPAAHALAELLAQTGERSLSVVVPAEQLPGRTIVRAPRAITQALPHGVEVSFRMLPVDETDEPRQLHAKAIVFGNREWVVGMIGSSNFTAAGLGLVPNAHAEINIVMSASASSVTGQALLGLIPEGPVLEPDDVEWEVQEDEDESAELPVPWGFAECLAEPGERVKLRMWLKPEDLPSRWTLLTPADVIVLEAEEWLELGEPRQLTRTLEQAVIPAWLKVQWYRDEEEHIAEWAVNVLDPAALPPPDELRDLPAALLIKVLASSRPIHEALARELELREKGFGPGDLPPELDPLKRYSSTGQLLRRAREVSAALEGLRRRLEQPVSSVASLRWRLNGPVGPIALANALVRDVRSEAFVPGEPSFILAELALTLSRTDWEATGRIIGVRTVRKEARSVLKTLSKLAAETETEPRLSDYVGQAFAEVSA
jgi:hypothetical protein